MTAPTPAACPDCAGPELVGHPAGLMFAHTDPCAVRDAEDATQAADAERAGTYRVGFARPLTDAESLLLHVIGTARGYRVAAGIACFVSYPSPGIRRREFRRP